MNKFQQISRHKEIFRRIIEKIPFPVYSVLSHSDLIIPYYHLISDGDVLHTKHLYPNKKIKQFRTDLDYILKHFKPISLGTLLALVRHDTPLPPKALLLTFDDGFREMFDVVAPILLQKGIPATFFINSRFTDNRDLCYQHKASVIVEYLLKHSISKTLQNRIEHFLGQEATKETAIKFLILAIKYDQRNVVDQIAEILGIDFGNYLQKHQPYLTTQQIHGLISNSFTIGGHSIDHPLYATITLEEQIRQTMESVRFVRNTFNLDYGAFAFPHSDQGVSKQYFNQIEKSGLVNVSFGTSGMTEDCVPNHFQRFSLEKPLRPAENILAYQFAKKIWRVLKSRDNLMRR